MRIDAVRYWQLFKTIGVSRCFELDSDPRILKGGGRGDAVGQRRSAAVGIPTEKGSMQRGASRNI